ncbi:MAG: putative glycoside hydrolase [Candidatus Binatia bacterium]|nr:putative glycoside hydrolase [Candidatus Binatia bacterium]MDP6796310.1 putative glycoside hydrolase [Candidatus Krumholzibacteria bacterium]MDP7021079.1 putative glycoside hydrolase [Candidatus Krumholzibacteria bacterium]
MNHKGVLLAGMAFLLLVPVEAPGEVQDFPHPSAPRLANYYLRKDVEGKEDILSRWDLLIIGYPLLDSSPLFFHQIRQLNPEQKILVYFNPVLVTEIPRSAPGELEYDYYEGLHPEWYAYTEFGDPISYWPSTFHMNITRHCPEVEGLSYRDYMLGFIEERFFPLIEEGAIDGIFLDEMSGGGYLWWDPLFEGTFDYNNDSVPDEPDSVAVWLLEGLIEVADFVGGNNPPGSLIQGNNCKPYHGGLDGKFYEAFPAFWENDLPGSLHDLDIWNSVQGAPNAITVNGLHPSDNIRRFRHRYTASLLSDNYFSYDHDTYDHFQLDWFELFDFELGFPRGHRYTLLEDPLIVEDFELGMGHTVIPSDSVNWSYSDNPDHVIQGEKSLYLESQQEYEYPFLAEIQLSNGFTPDQPYVISFRYRVLDTEAEHGKIWLKAWDLSGDPASALSSVEAKVEAGAEGLFRAKMNLEDFPDYRLYLRSHENVTLLIDSLTVVEGRGGLWARDYDYGTVVCNNSEMSRILPYNPDWVMVDADLQREHNPGWQVGHPIYLPHEDGLVFRRAEVWTSSPPVPTQKLRLEGPWPNPGNPAFSLLLQGREGERAEVSLHDIRGRRIASLWSGPLGPDGLRLDFRSGQAPLPCLAAGLYLIRVESEGETLSRKWLLLP